VPPTTSTLPPAEILAIYRDVLSDVWLSFFTISDEFGTTVRRWTAGETDHETTTNALSSIFDEVSSFGEGVITAVPSTPEWEAAIPDIRERHQALIGAVDGVYGAGLTLLDAFAPLDKCAPGTDGRCTPAEGEAWGASVVDMSLALDALARTALDAAAAADIDLPAAPGPFAVGTPSLFPPPAYPGSAGASGSGCAPGTDLLDGVWFGSLTSVGDGEIGFDLACFFFGEAAHEAGAADGVDEVPNDFYIRNASAQIRTIEVVDDVPVLVIVAPTDGPLAFAQAGLDDFTTVEFAYGASALCPGPDCWMWLYVNDGAATEIVEQYLP
jgi:hypothetical protein